VSDDHGVFLIGLVERQILAAARPRHQHRLDTHERHSPFTRQLTQHPPAMTRRLAGHRDTSEALRRSLPGGPVQGRTQIPRPAPERLARQHLRVMISDHDHLFLVCQVNADDRSWPGLEPATEQARTLRLRSPPRHAATVTHERPPPAMGHQARPAHQGDVPTSCIDTQNVFLCRCDTKSHLASGLADWRADVMSVA
jgi:hypothetical protein